MPPKKRPRDPVGDIMDDIMDRWLDAFTTNKVVKQHMAAWACRWQDKKHCDGPNEKVGVGKGESLALTTLQQHYPQIVYLCFSWWRKLLVIMVGSVGSFSDGKDPFLSSGSGSRSSRDLGTLGALSEVHFFLPKWSLRERRPLVPGTPGWRQKTPSFLSFLSSAIRHDQRDVVACLVENLQLDCGARCAMTEGIWEPLAEVAASRDRHKILATMLKRHTPVEKLVDGAFRAAVAHNALNTAKMLLDDFHVSNVNPDVDKWTPGLHHVAAQNYLEMASLMIRHGASVDPIGGRTVLHYANDPEFVDLFLNTTSVDVASSCTIDGSTALHRSISQKNLEVLQLLLEKGADINQATVHDRTPIELFFTLEWVEPSIYLAMMKLLVQYGGANSAVVATRFQGGNFPLHIVAGLPVWTPLGPKEYPARGGVQCATCTLPTSQPVVCTRCALPHHMGCIETSNLCRRCHYLESGRAVGVSNAIESDKTQAAEAAHHTETLEFLLQQGADLEARNAVGETALFACVVPRTNGFLQQRRTTIPLAILLKKGANVNALNHANETPLFLGIRGSNTEIVTMLLENGAEVNVANNQGVTPLHIVAGRKSLQAEFGKLLVDAGANPSARDNNGDTPLRIVARGSRSMEFAQLLLDAGADQQSKKNSDA